MGKGKRNSAILISSSDDEEVKDKNLLPITEVRYSKSAPTKKNPKRAKRGSVSVSWSCSSSFQNTGAIDFNEVHFDLCWILFTFIFRLRTLSLNKVTGLPNLR